MRISFQVFLACGLAYQAGMTAIAETERQQAANEAQDKPKPTTLAVVRTWKDLLSQPCIDMGDGFKVRLGIERMEVANHGAATVYAIFEDQPPNFGQTLGEDTLGPLKIKGTGKFEQLASAVKVFRQLPTERGYFLYRRLVRISEGEERQFTVTYRDKVLAEGKIILRKSETYHSWSGIDDHVGNDGADAPDEGIDANVHEYQWPGLAYMTPEIDQFLPYFRQRRAAEKDATASTLPERARSEDDMPLPSILPELTEAPREFLAQGDEAKLAALVERLCDDDCEVREAAQQELSVLAPRAHVQLASYRNHKNPEVRARIQELLRPFRGQLTISYDGRDLHVCSPRLLNSFALQNHLLLRVWVNGNPWHSQLKSNERKIALLDSHRLIATNAGDLPLSINIKEIGAQSGDMLSIQALYCPTGIHSDASERVHSEIQEIAAENLSTPTISNITTWKIP